ncbi:putative RNA splicing factor [Tieghemostelium lacteum]|uniref:Putative RNA splicing factor n=1 Tax=Tieghemostelium lacteum TaxID=361077 RepID=A0A151Z9H9_TIELA|nr:putative RNA splicing factor [Tieghemostelium lacteum]|eukprot:KYQ90610.1 putative RNA splicing factor [Tieghemostelium lacteum]
MPRIKTGRKKEPEGFEVLKATLDEFEEKMIEAQNEPHEGKRKAETTWPILQIHHQRSRYIYEMYYKKGQISKEVYDYCLFEKYADANLIAKWKKSGYERLCCLKCIQKRDSQSTCICRVPKEKLDQKGDFECQACGCVGCASGD